ncbi:MAG: DUF4105 domain-containing protein [Saprospiraceae bacterium]|nr:DUF4105 domain-containing protein [Saprospiraceae bacterium]
MRLVVALLSFWWLPAMGWTQAGAMDSILDNTRISLITCDPGDEIYSMFGHSAIRVNNAMRGYDAVYNYGTFNFNTPNFAIKFMRGKLPYRLSVYGFSDFLREYHHFKRGVREQQLIIGNEEKASVIRFLENNAKPENAEYKYDFFFDNCSSRIRDVFEQTLKYEPVYTVPAPVTFRQLLHRYLVSWPWVELGIDMIIGSKADAMASPTHQMFLPDLLHDVLPTATVNGGSFLGQTYDVLLFEEEKAARKIHPWFNPLNVNFVLMVLLLALIFMGKTKMAEWTFRSWSMLATFSGILILLLWFATDHQATKLNWNILWLNPLYLLLILKNSPTASSWPTPSLCSPWSVIPMNFTTSFRRICPPDPLPFSSWP